MNRSHIEDLINEGTQLDLEGWVRGQIKFFEFEILVVLSYPVGSKMRSESFYLLPFKRYLQFSKKTKKSKMAAKTEIFCKFEYKTLVLLS